jgi:hypothetical protein
VPLEELADALDEGLGVAEGVAVAEAVGVAVSSTTAPDPVLAAASTSGSSLRKSSNNRLACS